MQRGIVTLQLSHRALLCSHQKHINRVLSPLRLHIDVIGLQGNTSMSGLQSCNTDEWLLKIR